MADAFDLLIITDGLPQLVARVECALAHVGPHRVAVLLREPALATSALLDAAIALRQLTRGARAQLLISDRVDVALAAEADGVHLPERGFSPSQARALLGEHALIGVSRHDAEGLVRASVDGAHYATLSPVHHVPGKALPLGIDGFQSLLARAASLMDASGAQTVLPVYALGGVRHHDVPALLAAGARGVAVMREVLSADEPGESAQRLLAALSKR